LHWCGVDSEKHDGQLKRICAPLISLLRWLVTFPDDTIYFDRFIHLSKEELVKVNFPKHITAADVLPSKTALNISSSRSGSRDDAFELLCVLINDHRSIDDEPDPIDIMFLLKGNQQCQEKFEDWLQRANLDHVSEINIVVVVLHCLIFISFFFFSFFLFFFFYFFFSSRWRKHSNN
jgi:hypothetical protein